MAPRKILLIAAALVALLVLVPIGADFAAGLTRQGTGSIFSDGWMNGALLILAAPVRTWWYPWIAAYAIGFGFGAWADALVKSLSRRRPAIAPDNAFDFSYFERLVKRAREHVHRDIQANGLGQQPRISMDAANEVLAVMLYLARFGIATPMRGDYPHLPLQTFLVRSYHYLRLIEPRLGERDLTLLRTAENYRLAERESQLLKDATALPGAANDESGATQR